MLIVCSPTKAIEFVCGLADLLQSLFQAVRLIAVRTQDWIDDTLEEAVSCSVGVENAD